MTSSTMVCLLRTKQSSTAFWLHHKGINMALTILKSTYPKVDDLHQYLAGLGWTGTINDQQLQYLIDAGFSGGLDDAKYALGDAAPSSGGLNYAKVANFTTEFSGPEAGTIWEDRSDHLYAAWDTNDGYGALIMKGAMPQTLAAGDLIRWHMITDFDGAEDNYNNIRFSIFEGNDWRMDCGPVHDGTTQLGLARYNIAGAFQENQYMSATYLANQYYRAYIPSGGGNMVWQTSADDDTWNTMTTFAWTGAADWAIKVSYGSSTAVADKLIALELYDLEFIDSGAPV
jgi:hypothetical protein